MRGKSENTSGRCAAVILAGGRSQRMGRDKALLPHRQTTQIEYVWSILQSANLKVYVSGFTSHIMNETHLIQDDIPHAGPVAGLCAGITHLKEEYEAALFVPVDLPLLNKEVICLLSSQPRHAQAYYFEHHPLPCLLALSQQVSDHAARITMRLKKGEELSVKTFLSGLKSQPLPLPLALTCALTNTNTPQEWDKVQEVL